MYYDPNAAFPIIIECLRVFPKIKKLRFAKKDVGYLENADELEDQILPF